MSHKRCPTLCGRKLVSCIRITLTLSGEYPVDRGCRCSSLHKKVVRTCITAFVSMVHTPRYQCGSQTQDLVIRRQAHNRSANAMVVKRANLILK